MNLTNKIFVATLFISTCLLAVETKTKIDSTSQSIISRLNPALRKALLKALSNIEIEASNEKDESTEYDGIQTTTTSTRDEELLEESTAADLQALNLYNSYITDGVNYTQNSKDDNEIIHTIIVKAPKTTKSPFDVDRTSDDEKNDQVIIQFGAPDPVKDSDVHIETVQIARSVKTNEIDDNEGIDDDQLDDDNIRATTYKPSTNVAPTTTVPDLAKTTTEAPTSADEGANTERIANDVKIYQAPLVAAFTVQQDALGLPKNVIPLINTINTPPPVAKPIQEFTIDASTPFTTAAPPTTARSTSTSTFAPAITTTPFTLQLPSENSAPSFTLSKSLELPTTKEAAFTTFALEQKRKELEEQILFLQQQQREQERNFRQQQLIQEQRQSELLLQQRYRFEQENRARLQRYEQEQQYLNQQQFLNQQQARTPSLNQLPPPVQSSSSSVQVIPSLSFTTSVIPTQQLLPVREPNDFRPKPIVSFQPSQPLPPFITGPTAPHLATVPQLPLRPAQQFLSPPPPPTSFPSAHLNNIDPVAVSEQSRGRNRVFRQESNTGNFGLNSLNSVNTNFPPIFPVFSADSQLQNLLLQSGIGNGRSNEDLNIISKVLSLNHGIQTQNHYYPIQHGRFVRNATPDAKKNVF